MDEPAPSEAVQTDLPSAKPTRKRRGKRPFVSFLVCGASLLAASASKHNRAGYRVVDLGRDSTPLAINNRGVVVGAVPGKTVAHSAFIFHTGALDANIAAPYMGGANCINDVGAIVGTLYPNRRDVFERRAFVYERGKLNVLGTLGGKDSDARAVNNRGHVVGISVGSDKVGHGFLYENGQMRSVPLDEAHGINNSDDIVGSRNVSKGIYPRIHAAMVIGSRVIDIGKFFGDYSWAESINDLREVVGSYLTVGTKHQHAFLYKSGRTVDLGTMGGAASWASGINSQSDIVGGFITTDSDRGPRHAFLYKNGQMSDLNSLIPEAAGWVLLDARAINNKGQIVGEGELKGDRHGFLLTPISGT